MNNRSLETTLTGLIPALTGPIPPQLVNMAASLLALSRQRVGALKPEEESARAYLCAHIACERLRQPLDLPPIEPRPPLPKRQYSLLHKQFSNALPASGTGPSSPTKKIPPARPGNPRIVRRGPVAMQTLTRAADPICTLVVRVCTHQMLAPPTNTVSPPAATLIKHVLAATKVIKLSPPTAPIDTINAMATLSAIYILVTSKLSEKEITGEEYTRQRGQLCTVLEEVSSDWGCAAGWTASNTTKSAPPVQRKIFTRKEILKSPREGPVRVTILPNDVDDALNVLMANREAVDWLASLPIWSPAAPPDDLPPVQTADEATEFEPWVDPDEQAPKRQRINNAHVKRNAGGNVVHSGGAGIGRMLQDRVDYLSKKKRMAYIQWKMDLYRKMGGT